MLEGLSGCEGVAGGLLQEVEDLSGGRRCGPLKTAPWLKPGGRPRTTDMRRMLDGLFYVVRTGCQWRHLPPPPAFPPWRTVYGYFRDFIEAGVWESMRHHLVTMLRERSGRDPSPSAAIIDTQSVKTSNCPGRRAEKA